MAAVVALNALGFVPIYLQRGEPYGWLWGAPAEPLSPHGLGRGLTVGVSATLCADLLPRFVEASLGLVSCADVHAAVHRAFSRWERRSAAVHFVFVADGASAEVTVAATTPAAHPSLANSAAEVAYVTARGLVRTSSGVYAANATALVRAVVRVNADACFYVDTTFCAPLQLQTSVANPLQTAQLLLLLAWLACGLGGLAGWLAGHAHALVAILSLCVGKASAERWAAALRRARRRWCGRLCGGESGGAPREGTAAAARAARAAADARRRAPLCGVAGWVALLGLVVPPIVYWRAVLPCVECFDFEGALTHEVGHVLGLGHPDEAAALGLNLRAVPPPPAAPPPPPLEAGSGAFEGNLDGGAPPRWRPCAPRHVVAADAPDASGPDAPVMLAFAHSRGGGACPRADDLDGLAHLYPNCEADGVVDVDARCERPAHHRGWLRLAAWLAIPVGTIGALLCVASTLHARRRRRREALEHTQEVQTLRGALGNARRASAAVQAQHELWLSAMSADLQHSGSPGGRSRDLWHSALTATDLSGTRFASSRASTQGSRRSTQSGASAPRGAALAEMSTVAEASGAVVLTRTAPPVTPRVDDAHGPLALHSVPSPPIRSARSWPRMHIHGSQDALVALADVGKRHSAPGEVAESSQPEEMSTTVRQSHAVV